MRGIETMKLYIEHQDEYSRKALLLRTFLGLFYIHIPHIVMLVIALIFMILGGFVAFWSIVFTGKYPPSLFYANVDIMNWFIRYIASSLNLVDEYPRFGLNKRSEKAYMEVPYPVFSGKVHVFARLFLGLFYLIIPHVTILILRIALGIVITFLAWWVTLFTGEYPEVWHDFQVETIRWAMNVTLYFAMLTEDYPFFSGKEEDVEEE